MPSPWSFFHRFRNFRNKVRLDLSPQNVSRSILIAANVLIVGHTFRSYIGGLCTTEGISMIPTMPHSYLSTPVVLFSSLHRRGRNIRVGDVVTYTHPVLPGESGCKRVIGMPGDFVSVMTPGRIRGEDVEAVDGEGRWASVREQMVRVPEGHCWLAGDNLEWSRDSRLYGPLPLGLVRAKVLAVVLPVRDARWMGAQVDVVDPKVGEREWVMK
ncbi:LexA/Signal peptidase [Decorospora gaudefroyi]|uniref:Mitochondrial inner membrane protease subunit n=1 Tax=Decorospora gaudefroyi TaxID=184978 RepID=A0A6A5KPL5_9PLEO|nr:LexA/Signal peptidase [Decorospora gaudefroyi]